MNTAIVTRTGDHALATVETFRFTQDQRKLILDTCCGGASASEAAVLVGIAEMRGLNPLTQECYFVQRWDSQKGRQVWAVQISIDAMRIKAEESGLYSGQDEPEYEYEAGSKVPALARVKVYRRDWDRPCVGVARYSEYVQRKKDGSATRFWSEMPHNQLAKCAEAIALRKAFPRRLAKLYTADEMAQATSQAPETPEPVPGAYVFPSAGWDRLRSKPPATAPAPTSAAPPQVAPMFQSESSALGIIYQDQIAKAEDVPALKVVMATIKAAADAHRLTLGQVATLRDLTKARQKALKERPRKRVEEIMAGNEMPESWQKAPNRGDPEEGPPAPADAKCCFCGEDAQEDHVDHTTADGEIVWRHPDCNAFSHRGT
jgi:phage recombination protein Bet